MLVALDYTCDEVEAEADLETERAFQCDTNRSNKDGEISGISTQIGSRKGWEISSVLRSSFLFLFSFHRLQLKTLEGETETENLRQS